MPKTIQIDGALRFGWTKFKEHWSFLIPALVILWGASVTSDTLIEAYFKDIEPTATFLQLIASLFLLWLSFNWLRSFLAILDGRRPAIADLFSYSPNTPTYILASILYGLVIGAGFLLLIIPGIYFTLRYGMYSYLVADRRLGAISALRESARITDGAKWQLLLVGLVSIGIALLGVLALGIGLFVAVPVLGLAYASIYRSLLTQSGDQHPVVSTVTPPTVVPATLQDTATSNPPPSERSGPEKKA